MYHPRTSLLMASLDTFVQTGKGALPQVDLALHQAVWLGTWHADWFSLIFASPSLLHNTPWQSCPEHPLPRTPPPQSILRVTCEHPLSERILARWFQLGVRRARRKISLQTPGADAHLPVRVNSLILSPLAGPGQSSNIQLPGWPFLENFEVVPPAVS